MSEGCAVGLVIFWGNTVRKKEKEKGWLVCLGEAYIQE